MSDTKSETNITLSKVLYVRISEELHDTLKAEAEAWGGVSVSDYIRLIIDGKAYRPDTVLAHHPLVI